MSDEEKEEILKDLHEKHYEKTKRRSWWELFFMAVAAVGSVAGLGTMIITLLAHGRAYANLPVEVTEQGRRQEIAIVEVRNQISDVARHVSEHDADIKHIESEQQRLGQLAQDTHDDVKQIKDLLIQSSIRPIIK